MFKVHWRKAAYQALNAKHVDLSTRGIPLGALRPWGTRPICKRAKTGTWQ